MFSYRGYYCQEEDLFKMLLPLVQKVHSFAIGKVFNELVKIRSAETPISYKACLCSVRLQYNLPCKHILSLEKNQVPLSMFPRRWRFNFDEGEEGKFISTNV